VYLAPAAQKDFSGGSLLSGGQAPPGRGHCPHPPSRRRRRSAGASLLHLRGGGGGLGGHRRGGAGGGDVGWLGGRFLAPDGEERALLPLSLEVGDLALRLVALDLQLAGLCVQAGVGG